MLDFNAFLVVLFTALFTARHGDCYSEGTRGGLHAAAAAAALADLLSIRETNFRMQILAACAVVF